MNDCVFCKIISGELPSKKVLETEDIIAIEDLNPNAPVHILVMPKEHYDSILVLKDEALMAKLLKAAQQVAKEQGIDESGCRIVTNVGEDGGQSVSHLHFHVLGGKQLPLTLG